AAEPFAFLVLDQVGEPPPYELLLGVSEYRLDGGRVVANGQIGSEKEDDVARILGERAEPLGALSLVDLLRVARALECQRDLRCEGLDAFARRPRERLTCAE